MDGSLYNNYSERTVRDELESHLSVLVSRLTGRGVTDGRLGCPLGPHGPRLLQVEVHHGALSVLHHLQAVRVLVLSSSVKRTRVRAQSRSAEFLGELEDEEDCDHDGGHDEADEGPVGEHARC